MEGRIYNMHGPTVYAGPIEELIPQLIKFNNPAYNKSGLYQLIVEIKGRKYDITPKLFDY